MVMLMHVDVHRAYFNMHVDKAIFVELPPEDVCMGEPKQCGKVIEATSGTRRAAVACQGEVHKAIWTASGLRPEHTPHAPFGSGGMEARSSTAATFASQAAGAFSRR